MVSSNLAKNLYLYKYRDTNTIKLILKNSSMRFSRPTEFNDPFDCKAKIVTQGSLDKFMDFCRRRWPNDDMSHAAVLYEQNPKLFEEYIIEGANWTRDNVTKICCFSEINNNILMWSHYGENHKGVCLKFNVNTDKPFFDAPYKVEYRSMYPQYNYLEKMDDVIYHQLSIKAQDWQYEREIRVVKFDELETSFYNFKRESLTEIIFGCCAEDNFIKEIYNICKECGYNHILFKKAVMKENEYALDIISL